MTSLVADYGTDSESEDSEISSDYDNLTDSDTCSQQTSKCQSTKQILQNKTNPRDSIEKLPAPSFSAGPSKILQNSIFSNPFQDAEKAKNSILEKHVKMSSYMETDKSKDKSKKPICRNFVKGNCQRGSKCYFRHQQLQTVASLNVLNNSTKTVTYDRTEHVQPNGHSEQYEDDNICNKMKRKKSGITDRLVPPKKSLQQLDKQRQSERPWTFS